MDLFKMVKLQVCISLTYDLYGVKMLSIVSIIHFSNIYCNIFQHDREGAEIVQCNGNYGHNYPFEDELEPYIGGTRILWNFMKNHKRKQ